MVTINHSFVVETLDPYAVGKSMPWQWPTVEHRQGAAGRHAVILTSRVTGSLCRSTPVHARSFPHKADAQAYANQLARQAGCTRVHLQDACHYPDGAVRNVVQDVVCASCCAIVPDYDAVEGECSDCLVGVS